MQFQWLALAAFLLVMIADHFIVWPAFSRSVELDGVRARRALWARWMLMLWGASALVLWLWIGGGVPMASVGLAWPTGWRLWAPLGLGAAVIALQVHGAMKIIRQPERSAQLREQLGSTAAVLPHLASELPWWFAASVTAGFCEELLFRGFLVWLLQPMVGIWVAAILSVLVFVLGHAYQGREGMLRTGLLGLIFTAIVLVTGSLWVAILLHAAIDVMGGLIGWLIQREPPSSIARPAASTP
ncbi:CPBP family intramembrane glutamic endopeptidase [Roseateles sp.]|uniref:CPBP family intramembrane glutamic endopeptidase n=1 Tax=Roseateles sp. TaxID=1971397 RepID=UPI0025E5F79E|nr:type II CAAX endopeptidase family protein [Roseateles sp.]MBV8037196.1 CPBP family intramembrane metalloprotease [Roseateles sp.]